MPRSIAIFREVVVAAAVLTAAAPFATVSAEGGDARETVITVAARELPNLPGNRLTALVVTYAPGARSAR